VSSRTLSITTASATKTRPSPRCWSLVRRSKASRRCAPSAHRPSSATDLLRPIHSSSFASVDSRIAIDTPERARRAFLQSPLPCQKTNAKRWHLPRTHSRQKSAPGSFRPPTSGASFSRGNDRIARIGDVQDRCRYESIRGVRGRSPR